MTDDATSATPTPAPSRESPPAASGPPAWSYAGDSGPDRWSDLCAACAGRRQSPVDLAAEADPELPPLRLAYRPADLRWHHTHRSLQADVPADGSAGRLEVGGESWALQQFHFHVPAEHTVEGRPFAMELHFVHARGETLDDLAVVGVMFEEGGENRALAPLLETVPRAGGEAVGLAGFDFAALLPADLADYRYPGSLTTPPCSENVAWHVLRQPLAASAEQIRRLREATGANARPVQPLNGRTVRLARPT